MLPLLVSIFSPKIKNFFYAWSLLNVQEISHAATPFAHILTKNQEFPPRVEFFRCSGKFLATFMNWEGTVLGHSSVIARNSVSRMAKRTALIILACASELASAVFPLFFCWFQAEFCSDFS
jgi:hypothetical protein